MSMRVDTSSASRNADSAPDSQAPQKRREADAEAVDRFRALLLDRQPSRQQDAGGLNAAVRQQQESAAAPTANLSTAAADAAWAQAVARLWLDAPAPAQSVAPPPPAATLADIVERQLRQLLIGEGSGTVMLRLSSEAALPDAELLLSREAEGWRLRVSLGSEAPAGFEAELGRLAERFARRSLGGLIVEVT